MTPHQPLHDDENGDYRAKRRSMIEKTLTSMSGNVQINFLLNGVQHSVRRNSINRELMLKIGDADFQPCAEADIRSLLPIQSYSQKQLSQIGVKVSELNRFVRQESQQKVGPDFRNVVFSISRYQIKIQSVAPKTPAAEEAKGRPDRNTITGGTGCQTPRKPQRS